MITILYLSFYHNSSKLPSQTPTKQHYCTATSSSDHTTCTYLENTRVYTPTSNLLTIRRIHTRVLLAQKLAPWPCRGNKPHASRSCKSTCPQPRTHRVAREKPGQSDASRAWIRAIPGSRRDILPCTGRRPYPHATHPLFRGGGTGTDYVVFGPARSGACLWAFCGRLGSKVCRLSRRQM